MKKSITKKITNWILFIIYLGILFYLVFFAENMGRAEVASGYKYNFTFFSEIHRYWKYLGQWDELGRIAAFNIIGNIVAFIPFGIFMPALSDRKIGIIRTVVFSFMLSMVIEFVQLIFKIGCCDVDDLILNTCGGLIGYILVSMLYLVLNVGKNSSKEV